ncbi:MAG: ABC transporter ATP-binding protein [Oscillospiraceae bacterium]
MDTLLHIENLAVTYGSPRGAVQAVRGVDFDILHGETVALVGESGCGKSVTAKSIMGLVKAPGKILPESRILFEGTDVTQYDAGAWAGFRGKECALVFQDALVALNPTQRIGKQVMEVLKNHKSDMSAAQRRAKALEMLRMTGIADVEDCFQKYPHELSGGQRQRAVIAMAMIAGPKLLIADEPTTSLDVTIQAQILALMKELQRKFNMSILLITHDLGVVADVADRIMVMYAGKIVESGSRRDIFYHPQHPYTQALLRSIPRPDLPGKQPLHTIAGAVPDMAEPPEGCAFWMRCPYAMNICAHRQPEEEAVAPGHRAACWRMAAQQEGAV